MKSDARAPGGKVVCRTQQQRSLLPWIRQLARQQRPRRCGSFGSSLWPAGPGLWLCRTPVMAVGGGAPPRSAAMHGRLTRRRQLRLGSAAAGLWLLRDDRHGSPAVGRLPGHVRRRTKQNNGPRVTHEYWRPPGRGRSGLSFSLRNLGRLPGRPCEAEGEPRPAARRGPRRACSQDVGASGG
jgi:hypothetical protein